VNREKKKRKWGRHGKFTLLEKKLTYAKKPMRHKHLRQQIDRKGGRKWNLKKGIQGNSCQMAAQFSGIKGGVVA